MTRGTGKLYATLSERRGAQVSTVYGESCIHLNGTINDTDFYLLLSLGSYPEAVSSWRKSYESSGQEWGGPEIPVNSIGVINVTPNALPSEYSNAPFSARVYLAQSEFDSAALLIDSTFNEGRLLTVRIDIRSDQFDANDIDPQISELNLSSGFQGFVFEFELASSLFERIPLDQRPVNLPPKTHEQKTTIVSINVTSVYIRHSMPGGYIGDLSCEGLLTARQRSIPELDGAQGSVQFREYETSDGLYPKESLSGEFDWDKGSRGFSIELRYRKADLSGCLAPLFLSSASDAIRIEIGLLAKLSEFEKESLHGEISYWSVCIYRKLIEEKPKGWSG